MRPKRCCDSRHHHRRGVGQFRLDILGRPNRAIGKLKLLDGQSGLFITRKTIASSAISKRQHDICAVEPDTQTGGVDPGGEYQSIDASGIDDPVMAIANCVMVAVVAGTTRQGVVARQARDHVVQGRPRQQIVAACTRWGEAQFIDQFLLVHECPVRELEVFDTTFRVGIVRVKIIKMDLLPRGVDGDLQRADTQRNVGQVDAIENQRVPAVAIDDMRVWRAAADKVAVVARAANEQGIRGGADQQVVILGAEVVGNHGQQGGAIPQGAIGEDHLRQGSEFGIDSDRIFRAGNRQYVFLIEAEAHVGRSDIGTQANQVLSLFPVVDIVRAIAPTEQIDIVPSAALHEVIAAATGHDIVTRATRQIVAVIATGQAVIATETKDRVIPLAAVDDIVATGSDQHVAEFSSEGIRQHAAQGVPVPNPAIGKMNVRQICEIAEDRHRIVLIRQ